MTFDFFSKEDRELLFNGFSISPLFYNFLLEILPDLGIDENKLKKYIKFNTEPILDGKRVSLYKAYKLWIAIEKSSNRSDIGLLIADYFTPDKAGLLGKLFLNTANLRESIEILKRFLSLLINDIYFNYEEGKDISIFYFDIVPRFIIPFSVTECYAKICYNWVKEYNNNEDFYIEEINFYAKEPLHIDYYKNNFPNSSINFNQSKNYIILKKELFYKQYKREKNNSSNKFLLRQAQFIKENIFFKSNYTHNIINQIILKMPEGKINIKDIAEDLNISESTLKRKLKSENTTFKKLTELIRKKLAVNLIKDKNISFEEISYLLGYSEYSPFFRAFKKWYKSSPSKYREAL